MRPVTLFSGQWADLDIEVICQKAKEFGYDGIEVACWGNHMEIDKADENYCANRKKILKKYGLKLYAISAHLVGQAVCDNIDIRHKAILPAYVWGNGDAEGVRQRAAKEIIAAGHVAKRLGIQIVNGFTGSSIWQYVYSFPAVPEELIDQGYKDFAKRWKPILDEFQKIGVKFALEVHPTEIAFDTASAERALKAIDYHPSFGFNYDPSHLGYQGVDYVDFIHRFRERIFHVHMKDVFWKSNPGTVGIFGGHVSFGDPRRYWDFRSLGRGCIRFEEVIRALNHIHYEGPLSVEWEDSGMDREAGAAEACRFVKNVDFKSSNVAFDAAFERK